MYKDQHPLHGAQLCQVGGSFFFLIWSFSSNKVHGWVLPPCWAPWGENFRSSDLLTICATYKKDNSCHLQKNRTIFILNIIQLTDLVFMGNPLEEELSEAEDYNNRVVRSLHLKVIRQWQMLPISMESNIYHHLKWQCWQNWCIPILVWARVLADILWRSDDIFWS